jgi:hypothetical protein
MGYQFAFLFAIRRAVNYLHIHMGQVLRITFQNVDHTFQILNSNPVSQETKELHILLDGVTHTLVCVDKNWVPQEGGEQIAAGLITAIAKTIASRYRI